MTHREKHITVIALITILIILASGIDQETLNQYELLWLLFYVTPLGLYLLTDPNRRKYL